MRIDDFDRAILKAVQTDNQQTHTQIGEAIGLSNSAVRRRLKILRETGVIMRDVSILAEDAAGVTVIIEVTFTKDTPEGYAAFDEKMRQDPRVKQAYHVSGSIDYIVIVQAPSLQWYEGWAKRVLMSDENLRRHDTHVVYSCKKFETAIDLPEAPAI